MTGKKLTLEQIREISFGIAYIEECDEGIILHRFTKEQEQLYSKRTNDFYLRCFTTAGVGLEFDTDSSFLRLSVTISSGSSRNFFVHSILVNGKHVDELCGEINSSDMDTSFDKTFQLESGMKRVQIVFPWTVVSKLVALELDENARVISVSKKRKMLMFGDSITQGYDAYMPENTYTARLATIMNADVCNKGIGGEVFWAELAFLKEDIEPDVITVAYGTNDWNKQTKEEFEQECKGFYTNLSNLYPNSQIYALAPLWRKDIDDKKIMGEPFDFIAEYMKKVVVELDNVTLVNCIDFIPHELQYYQTDGLHPIDGGFEIYAKRLHEAVEQA